MDTVLAYLLAIIALGALIVFHEAGHFLAARFGGMDVEKFSIGFGPALAKFEKWGTRFQIGPIPLGGFVQIGGMSPLEEVDPLDGKNYRNKPFHLKFATIIAGPAANYLIGFLLFWVFFALSNEQPRAPIVITAIVADSPAEAAGLLKDDLIVGTSSTTFVEVRELSDTIQASNGAPLELVVRRGAENLRVQIVPRRSGDRLLIGVGLAPSRWESAPLPVGAALSKAAGRIIPESLGPLQALSALFRKGSGARVSGPLGMIQDLSRTFEGSYGAALFQIARISIMLGLFNLLPIPGLDGSRLSFLLLEVVRKREMNPKLETVVHLIGFGLLAILMIVATVGDILK